MAAVHITLLGTVIALCFAASIGGVIWWMLHLPEQTPVTLRVAKAVRLTEHANLILVPVQGAALSDRMVALGAQMAKARQAEIEVLYLIEVPWTLPLNARLPAAQRLAEEVLDRARRIAARFGVHLQTQIINTRDAGQAIVDEASVAGADIILMGDVPERTGETRFSKTTSYVFTHAPCEVIIDRPALGSYSGNPTAPAAVETTRNGR
ncbi:MAG TPA: universal stress protein [Chloroflexota bacterium]|nr:universal stress protein [Chloroflexota bacterium]